MDHEHLELLVTREMPYGKYKGRLIADLPGYYLNWFARKGFPPGELGPLLQKAIRSLIAPCVTQCYLRHRNVVAGVIRLIGN